MKLGTAQNGGDWVHEGDVVNPTDRGPVFGLFEDLQLHK